jgi:diacylglycerol kinase (ATP)
MPTAKAILNPYASRWRAQENMPRVKAALDRAGIAYDLVVTQRADEGIDLAAGAARAGFGPVVAIGGDSTCSEVINGLVEAAGDAPGAQAITRLR